MGIDFSIPLAGMDRAEASLNTTATQIAGISVAGIGVATGTTGQGDTVDLSAEMIALMEARNNFAVNAKLAQAENQVAQISINLLG